MITSWKHVTRWMSVSLSSLLLLLLLVACGGGGSGSATPTAQPPTATPTTAPTATTAPSAQMKTYTGTGFSIEYPANWTLQNSQSAVVFTDPQKLNTLTFVTVPNPGGALSASQQASAALALLESGGVSNPQPVSLPATTTVAGASWAQRGITGTVTSNGVTGPAEIIVLANNHPASSPTTKTYEIYYGGPTLSFQQENSLVFQPMLQTFKFTS